jgi:hypothetical protein
MKLSNKYLFNDYMLQHGGRLEREDIDQEWIKGLLFDQPYDDFCDFLSEIENSTLLLRLSNNLFADYIFNSSANARAKKLSTNYFIGVNFGFVDTISLLINTLLSHPSFLKEWFDPSDEDNSRLKNLEIEEFRLEDREMGKEKGAYLFDGYISPLSAERRYIATIITQICIQFAFLHELGHVVGGHLDLKKGLKSFDENLKNEFNILFEFDADLIAVQIMLYGILPSKTERIVFPDKHNYNSQQLKMIEPYLCILLSISVTLVLILFSQRRPKKNELIFGKTHPNPLERLANIENYLLSHLNYQHWLVNKLFIRNWFSVSTAVYNDWIKLGLPNWDFLDVQDWEKLRITTLQRQQSNIDLIKKLNSVKEREVGINIVNYLISKSKDKA